MRLWPFGKRGTTQSDSVSTHKEDIVLYQSDDSLDRARKIFQASGLGMNLTALALLPGAANAIEAYRRMDAEAAKTEQAKPKRTKRKKT